MIGKEGTCVQALIFDGALHLAGSYPQPAPQPGEALIRISLAGICNTDLEIVRGYAGFSGVLGHEFVGVVEQVGRDGDRGWIGRRVVGEINIACGSCRYCRSGMPTHCAERAGHRYPWP